MPLSQDYSKPSGQCCVCFAIHQLHVNDGRIRVHGPRNNPCSGSNQLPLSSCTQAAVNSALPDSFLRLSAATSSPPDDFLHVDNRSVTLQPSNNLTSTCQLQHPQAAGPIIKHIPKSARPTCAKVLTDILMKIVQDYHDIPAWSWLLNFAIVTLVKPSRTGQEDSLTSVIKKRASNYLLQPTDTEPSSTKNSVAHRSKRPHEVSDDQLAKIISSKLEDGNIRSALRMLLSEDKPAADNDDTLNKLRERHPLAPVNRKASTNPQLIGNCLQVSEADVKKAISSFPNGSSGGPDCLRPQHVCDMVSSRDAGPALLTVITAFVNMLLRGQCAPDVIPILFGANLTALTKKSGGIRPIAVGYYWRRLTAKCANYFASAKLATYFSPIQLGVGVPGGCRGL